MPGGLERGGKRRSAQIENGEESVEIYSAKGHLQFETEQYEDAVRSYEKLLALSPRHKATHFNLGICYEKLGRWHEAIEGHPPSCEPETIPSPPQQQQR